MREREFYIDNIRIILTVLVILHHTAITYGASGGWYYSEPGDGLISGLLLTVFVSSNQAYFMGLFFFLSSYFIPASYERKGPMRFLADRFKRLGIPIVAYVMILSPITIYLLVTMKEHQPVAFLDSFMRPEWMEVGVLWFTTALLLFTVIYVFIRRLPLRTTSIPAPSNQTIFFFALMLGVISFAVRIVFPIGFTLKPMGFQLAHFPQYIALFTVGIVAYLNNWLSSITYQQGKFWLRFAVLLVVLGFPSLYVLKIVTHSELDAFLGGLTIQSFINAIWEQLLGIALIMTWLGITRYKWNTQSNLMKEMSRSAYAVYIIHPLVLVFIALLVRDIHLPSLVKFMITGAISVSVSFTIGALLIRIPGVKQVV